MKLSPRSHLELKFEDEVWSHFPFLKSVSCMWMYIYIDYPCWWGHQKTLGQVYFGCKFQLFTISPPYPHTRRLLERQSSNNHLKLTIYDLVYNFLRITFSRKFSQYPVKGKLLCKILSEAAPCAVDLNHSHYEKFRIFLRMISMTDSHFSVPLRVKRVQRY